MVTDYILAGECVILAICLVGKARAGAVNSTGFWVPAFLTFALAALAGGTAHGFRLDLGEVNHAIVWRVTVWSIVAAAAMMLVAGLHSTLRPDTDNPTCRAAGVRWLKWGAMVSAVGLALMALKVSVHENLNHNDVYHVIQMLGLFFFYRAALLLEGVPE